MITKNAAASLMVGTVLGVGIYTAIGPAEARRAPRHRRGSLLRLSLFPPTGVGISSSLASRAHSAMLAA